MHKNTILIIAILASFSGQSVASSSNKQSGYAEALYMDYSNLIYKPLTFNVDTLSEMSLTDYETRTIGSLTTASNYEISVKEGAITKQEFGKSYINRSADLDKEQNASVEDFDALGLPIEQGKVRKLLISLKIGSTQTTHEALEFCWEKQDYCTVLDGSIANINQTVLEARSQLLDRPLPYDVDGMRLAKVTAQGYSEFIYKRFSDVSRGAVNFEVIGGASGRLANIADILFDDIMVFPSERLTFSSSSLQWSDFNLVAANDFPERHFSYRQGLGEGKDLSAGGYRFLDVTLTLKDEQPRLYRALEICEVPGRDCFLYDPLIKEIDSAVQNEVELRKIGWYTKVFVGNDKGAVSKSHDCGGARQLARNASKPFKFKQLLGLVEGQIGQANGELQCDRSCVPAYASNLQASTVSRTTGLYQANTARLAGQTDTWKVSVSTTATKMVGATGIAYSPLFVPLFHYRATGDNASYGLTVVTNGDKADNEIDLTISCSKLRH